MQKVFVILAIKYPACIQYKQNIYMYFKPYEKENSLQSDFELVFVEAWPGTYVSSPEPTCAGK